MLSIDEPVGIVFGEPDAAQLKALDYEVDEMMPISGGVLNGKAVSKPVPVWPPEAREVGGTVTVRILVNEEGKVIKAERCERACTIATGSSRGGLQGLALADETFRQAREGYGSAHLQFHYSIMRVIPVMEFNYLQRLITQSTRMQP